MLSIPFTLEGISIVAGFVLSLAFEFAPKLKLWLDNLTKYKKMVVMALLSAIFALAIFALACYTPLIVLVGLVCNAEGFRQLIQLSLLAFGANQVMFVGIKLFAAAKKE